MRLDADLRRFALISQKVETHCDASLHNKTHMSKRHKGE